MAQVVVFFFTVKCSSEQIILIKFHFCDLHRKHVKTFRQQRNFNLKAVKNKCGFACNKIFFHF